MSQGALVACLFVVSQLGPSAALKPHVRTDLDAEVENPLFQAFEKEPDRADAFIAEMNGVLGKKLLEGSTVVSPSEASKLTPDKQELRERVAGFLQETQAVSLNKTFSAHADFVKLPLQQQQLLLQMGSSVKDVLGNMHLADAIVAHISTAEKLFKEHPEVLEEVQRFAPEARSMRESDNNEALSRVISSIAEKMPGLAKQVLPMIMQLPKLHSGASLLQSSPSGSDGSGGDEEVEEGSDGSGSDGSGSGDAGDGCGDDGGSGEAWDKLVGRASPEEANEFLPPGFYVRSESGVNMLFPVVTSGEVCTKMILNLQLIKLCEVDYTDRSSPYECLGYAGFMVMPIGLMHKFGTWSFAWDLKVPIPFELKEYPKKLAGGGHRSYLNQKMFPHLKTGFGIGIDTEDTTDLQGCKDTNAFAATWFIASGFPFPDAWRSPTKKGKDRLPVLIQEPMWFFAKALHSSDYTVGYKHRFALQSRFGGHQMFCVVVPMESGNGKKFSTAATYGSTGIKHPTGITVGSIIHMCPDILSDRDNKMKKNNQDLEKNWDKMCHALGYKMCKGNKEKRGLSGTAKSLMKSDSAYIKPKPKA